MTTSGSDQSNKDGIPAISSLDKGNVTPFSRTQAHLLEFGSVYANEDEC